MFCLGFSQIVVIGLVSSLVGMRYSSIYNLSNGHSIFILSNPAEGGL